MKALCGCKISADSFERAARFVLRLSWKFAAFALAGSSPPIIFLQHNLYSLPLGTLQSSNAAILYVVRLTHWLYPMLAQVGMIDHCTLLNQFAVNAKK